MDFENKTPEWNKEGTEPSSEMKTRGFSAGYKPPAAFFNWFWNSVSKNLAEIKRNLSNVDNTADVDKSVKRASTAGTADKTSKKFIFQINNGTNEGTDKFSFDGSAEKSINITPSLINAAEKNHTHSKSQITDFPSALKNPESLTIQMNGTTAVTYDGDSSKSVDITPDSIGLGNVDNTSDSTKSVKFASTAGTANKTNSSITVRFNGGTTEGENQFTFDGSVNKSVNITPSKLGIVTTDGTMISQNADYAEVGEWVDGNPDGENRTGYFVAIDKNTSGTTMVKASSDSDVRGVVVSSPAFSGGCSDDKFDADGNLLKQYDYVAVMGLVSVIDNGTCTINERCMAADDGTAIPSLNNMGYQVVDRIDSAHILIALEPSADMLIRIKKDVTEIWDKLNDDYVTVGNENPSTSPMLWFDTGLDMIEAGDAETGGIEYIPLNIIVDATLTESGKAADSQVTGQKLAQLESDIARYHETSLRYFTQLKELLENGGAGGATESAIAILDEAILDMTVLS